MISFSKILKTLLTERMSFRALLAGSESGRKERGRQDVKASSIRVATIDGNEAWTFRYKSNPSTTGHPWHGYIQFLKKDVSEKDSAEDLECRVDCDCFSGDILVLMNDGTYKPIRDIIIGDEVYTHRGRIKRVTNVMTRAIKPLESLYNIRVSGFPGEMVVTENHPFYTLRGNDKCLCGCHKEIWESVYSHQCSSPLLILTRKYVKGHYSRPQVEEDKCEGLFEWTQIKNLRDHEWCLTPWLEEGKHDFNNTLFARLVGYYLAEGCISNKNGTTVRLTFNINEWDTLGNDVIKICDSLGYTASRFKSNHGNWFDIRINNKYFKNFCIQHIGMGSAKKKLSATIMSWNNDCIKNVFIGAILGDGWIDPSKGMKYFSINFNLISQMATILNKLQIRNSISILNTHTNDSTRNMMYQVIIPRGNSAEQVRMWLWPYLREKDKFESSLENLHSIGHHRQEGQLRPIMSCEKSGYNGLVYDITVEDDESFIANGIAVHNCPDYRYRYAYNNAKADVGRIGRHPDWRYGNDNNGQKWRPRSQGGVGDYGVGLCKHLCGLAKFLKTTISPDAPEPEDQPPIPKKKPVKKPLPPAMAPQTVKAPTPDDSYNDSRAGSDTLTEKVTPSGIPIRRPSQGVSQLYKKLDAFAKQNPEFDVTYEDDSDD